MTLIHGEEVNLEEVKKHLQKKGDQFILNLRYAEKNLPNLKKNILEKADRFYEGKMILPGTGGQPYFIGNPPRWFDKVGDDNEYIWTLNRHEHWVTLLQATILSGDKKYQDKAVNEFLNWYQEVYLKMNEGLLDKEKSFYSQGHPLRILECGIRLFRSWPFFLYYLTGTGSLTNEILTKYIDSSYTQTEIIRKYSPLLWPKADHNHYLMENLGMLQEGILFPELQQSKKWKATGIQELNRASEIQLTKEGGQIEGCPSYHNECMLWFGIFANLAKEEKLFLTPSFESSYLRGLDYTIHSLRLDGNLIPFGDSRSDKAAIETAFLGVILQNNPYWVQHLLSYFSKEEIIENSVKVLPYVTDGKIFFDILKEIIPLKKEEELPTHTFNSQLGQIYARNSWKKGAAYFGMTARSPIQNNHAHIDMLSFEYGAKDKIIIADPGVFTYRDSKERRYFKSSLAHSTVVLNDKDFFEYQGNFKFGPQKESHLTEKKNYDFGIGGFGYNLAYSGAKIYRSIYLLQNDVLIVRDNIETDNLNQKLTRSFHLNYQQLEKTKSGWLALDKGVKTKIVSTTTEKEIVKIGATSENYNQSESVLELQFIDNKIQRDYFTIFYPFSKDEPEILVEKKANDYDISLNGEKYLLHDNDLQKVKRTK